MQGGRLLTAWPVWLAAAGLAAGAGVAWLISQAGPNAGTIPDLPLALPVAVLVGWSLIGSGLLAARSQREDHLALVLIFTGFAWFASMLPLSHNPVLFTAGEVLYSLYYAGFLYLILSFPAGRLQGKLDRALMVIAIALVTVGQVAWLFFADPRRLVCPACPANLLEVARDDGIAKLLYSLRQVVGLVIAAAAIGLLAGRWRRASRPQRRAVMPVVVAGAVALAVLIASYVAAMLGMPAAPALGQATWFVTAAIPVAVLLVFIQRRLAQGAVAGLVVELGAPGAPGAAADLRGALSRALGDPSLALAYWYPAESRYVDSGGRPVELPEVGAGRGSTVIERDGQPVAALIHDPALDYNPGLIDSVCAAAGLTLDNERLAAELRARLVELQASRARLVETADTERRRIERNLHDGAQQQLVALKISLGLARQLVTSAPGEAAGLIAQTEQQAADALEELRELARGIYPPLLADLGLRAALEAQARRAVIPVTVDAAGLGRYPQQIEAAVYFCVLEALQNIAKYAQAPAARVTLRPDGHGLAFTVEDDGQGFDPATTPRGTGLRGISDRLGALGGTADVTSAPGCGTRVTGRVPGTEPA
ncbi:MAG TPA: sensor histidine kinase [Streptosporangiaceae bacterium]